MELMSPIFLSVEGETAIAEGELAVGLSGCNLVGQDTTHGVFAFVGHDALAEVHHATTLCHDVSTSLGIVTDTLTSRFHRHQRLQVFLRIATREVEQVTIAQVGHISLGVEEGHTTLSLPSVKVLLIIEGERLGIPCHHNFKSLSHLTFSSNSLTNVSFFVSSEKSSPK